MEKPRGLRLQQSLIGVIFFEVFSTLAGLTLPHAAEPSLRASYALLQGTNEFSLWAGGSPDSFGNIEDRQVLLVGLRYGRVLAAWDWVSLEYTLDVFPAAVVFEPNDARTGNSTIYGAGLSPLGFKLRFAQQSRIKPFLAASVGFLYFEHDIPLRDTSRFNFTPEIGLGIDFFVTPKTAITIGYKFHHMSNAGISSRNPGLNSNVIYSGFSFFTP